MPVFGKGDITCKRCDEVCETLCIKGVEQKHVVTRDFYLSYYTAVTCTPCVDKGPSAISNEAAMIYTTWTREHETRSPCYNQRQYCSIGRASVTTPTHRKNGTPVSDRVEVASDPRAAASLYGTTLLAQRHDRFCSHLIHGDRPDALHDPRFVEPDDVVQPPTFLTLVDVVVNVGRRRQKLLRGRAVSFQRGVYDGNKNCQMSFSIWSSRPTCDKGLLSSSASFIFDMSLL